MDKYLDFVAINGLYHFDNTKNKFIEAPYSKSDIFNNKNLSIGEKK